MLDKAKNRMSDVTEFTFEKIKEIAIDVYNEGAPISTLAERLTDLYDGFTAKRSVRIARTEMTMAVNGGAWQAYRQTGVTKKEWISTQDEDTRETHSIIDGTVVKIDEPFVVGDYEMFHPGDPKGGVEEVANCRCALAPVVD
jgi:SPP1 gp7 family putative phage head morphogenesis protein